MAKTPAPIVPPTQKEFQLPAVSPYTEFQLPDAPKPNPSPIANFTAPPSSAPAAQPITNTDVTTSADMNTVQGSAIPTSGQGYFGGKVYNQNTLGALQSTAADKPTDYLTPQAREMMGYGKAAVAGYNAGANIQPTTSGDDAVAQVAGSTISGAAGGAAAGGPWGALVGGLTGLVSGGINAFVGTHSARAQARKQEKLRQEIMAKDEARYQQARADQEHYFQVGRQDTQEQLRYNRRMEAVQSTWKAQEAARGALNDAISQDVNMRQLMTQEAR